MIATIVCGIVAKGDYPKEEGVLVITPDTFGEAYKEFKHLIVEFYAPWCGQCKGFAPHYVQLVKLLGRMVPGIKLAKMDCEAHKQFCENQEVQSYPTIVYYDNGKERKFKGRPSVDSMMKWIDGILSPIEIVDTYAKLHHRRRKNDHSIVLVAPRDSPYAEIFTQLSIENPAFKWFHFCEDHSQLMSLNPPRILINNTEEENLVIPLENLKDKASIAHKIEVHRYPKTKRYEDQAILEMIYERNRPVLLFIAESDKTYQTHKKMLDQVNEKTLETAPVVIFVKDKAGNQADRVLNYFGVNTYPFILYMKQIKVGEMVKYYYRGKYETQEILKFIEDASAGKLKIDYKSEPVPTENNKPVKVLVGSNFRDIVTKDRDVVVTYRIPECKICDEFTPVFEEVAAEFQKAGSPLMFATVNSKDNDPGVYVMGYPSIKLHKRGEERKVEDFTDKERTKHQFITFLGRHGFKLPEDKKESSSSEKGASQVPHQDKSKEEAPHQSNSSQKAGKSPEQAGTSQQGQHSTQKPDTKPETKEEKKPETSQQSVSGTNQPNQDTKANTQQAASGSPHTKTN